MKYETELDQAIRDAFAEEIVPRQIHGAILAACNTLPEKRAAGKQRTRGAGPLPEDGDFVVPGEYKKAPLFRRLALAALCLIAAGSLGLLGLNAVSPELAESLPGLGGLFQTINGGRQESSLPEKLPELPSFPEQKTGLFDLPVEDNGTILQKIEVAEDGSKVEITAEVPFMGRTSYNPMQYYQATPYGTWANLQTAAEAEQFVPGCMAGTLLGNQPEVNERGNYQTGSGLSDVPSQVTWEFNYVDTTQPLVFTLYESDLFWDAREPLGDYRVTAEFMIDLKTGTATPSEYYKKARLQKITPQECLSTQRITGFTDGWFAKGVSYCPLSAHSASSQAYYRIDLLGEDRGENLILECYQGDGLVGAVFTQSEGERGKPVTDDAFLASMGNEVFYQSANGVYADGETEPGRMKEQYRHVVFGVSTDVFGFEEQWQESQALINDEIRFALRNADTGELIYEDVMEQYRKNKQAIKELYKKNTGYTQVTKISEIDIQDADPDGENTRPGGTVVEIIPSPIPYTSPMPSPTPLPYTSPVPVTPVSPEANTSHALENEP